MIKDMVGKRVPLSWITVIKNPVIICGCSGDRDGEGTVIRQRVRLECKWRKVQRNSQGEEMKSVQNEINDE